MKPDLRDSRKYPGFFAHTLASAIFPRMNKHPLAIASGLENKGGPREWILTQVHHGVMDPHWQRLASVGKLSASFSKLFRRLRRWRYHLYLTPEVSIEISDMRNVSCERRMEPNQRSLVPGNLGSQEYKPDCIAF